MANAKFTINGNASSNRGYDTTAASSLVLQLETLPALDVYRCQYSQVTKTKNAPDLTIPNGGEPATPAGTLTITGVPSGVHAWKLRCVVNNGVDARGNVVPEYTFERIVAIRSGGLRKIITGETGEYDATYGWPEAYNEYLTTAGIVGADVNLANAWSQPQTFAGVTASSVTVTGNVNAVGDLTVAGVAEVSTLEVTGGITVPRPAASPIEKFTFRTEHQTGTNASLNLQVMTGVTSSADSGYLDIATGPSTSANSGWVSIHSGNANGGTSGNIIIYPGNGAVVGNIALNGEPSSYQGMQRGIFVGNSVAIPTGNPTGGGFLFAQAGALRWRGTSGTVTTIAPAEPHCPTCGRDFVTQHVNGDDELSLCLCCMVDTLEDAGIDVGRFAFVRNLGT
ncbi:hypothetical protein [Sorangium sp. So ce1389]|uniref:hypothetical protein n=1 Tax=Sorangium sp. So ce1389 TaxID=3133336 RepID=UPI003F5DF722